MPESKETLEVPKPESASSGALKMPATRKARLIGNMTEYYRYALRPGVD